jgi:hypothetical protein
MAVIFPTWQTKAPMNVHTTEKGDETNGEAHRTCSKNSERAIPTVDGSQTAIQSSNQKCSSSCLACETISSKKRGKGRMKHNMKSTKLENDGLRQRQYAGWPCTQRNGHSWNEPHPDRLRPPACRNEERPQVSRHTINEIVRG